MKRFSAWLITILIAASCVFTAYAETDGADFDMLNVPQIRVTTEDGNGTSLLKADGYVNAHIVITDTDNSVLEDDVQFKVRGNTTAMDAIPKKAFNFKFKKKKDVLGLGSGKKWVLLANAFDPTLLRNDIANHLAHTLELPYTSERRFVELWVDGSYRGCYELFEPVAEGKDRVNIDIESNGGKKDFLIELEKARVEEDKTYFTVDGMRFVACEPEEPDEEQLAYITDTVAGIVDVLKNGSQEDIEAVIDVDSFSKYYVLNEYIKALDFDSTSVKFFYQDGVLYAGPAWDYDLSSGNINGTLNSSRYKKAANPDGLHAYGLHFYKYLCEKPWFIEKVREVYAAYYDDFANVTADGGLIDSEYEEYADLFARNFSKDVWRVNRMFINIQKPCLSTYEENLAFLKTWLSDRSDWMTACYDPFFEPYLCGDADGDGEVTIFDATMIQRTLARIETPSFNRRAADFNRDGLDVIDATSIQRHVAKIPVEGNLGVSIEEFTLGK